MALGESSGAGLLVRGLVDIGIDTVFSLSGNQIMPVYDALRDAPIRLIHARHEGAAVYMAEAAAQATDSVGVALLTAAPGFANGLSAMLSARESETPILVLSGDAPIGRAGRGAFQEMDQCAAAKPLVKASFRLIDPESLAEDVARAAALAGQGRPGPVHLALPDDVLKETVFRASKRSTLPVVKELDGISGSSLDVMRTELLSSQKPIILLGPAFCRPRWKPLLSQIVERLGVPVVPFESPRGLKAPRLGRMASCLSEADLVIALGKPLDFMVAFGEVPTLAQDCRILAVHADEHLLSRDQTVHHERWVLGAQANPFASLHALLEGGEQHRNGDWCRRILAAISHRPAHWFDPHDTTETIYPTDLARAVQPLLSTWDDPALIIDGGEIGQWSQALLDARVSLINGPSGAIGASLPYAIATRAVRPNHPVVAIMGDGTAGFYLAEFETAVREELPFIAIVGNDAKWNAEHQIQLRDYGPDRLYGCTLTAARYDLAAAALGGHGEFVTRRSDLEAALGRAVESGKPSCVNVLIEGWPAPTNHI
ncbi:MAG: thiamine pyrophosphate-binding protein [Hyphomicrobiaceae bacterium]